MKKNVLLFYGGESVEHDISIITALQVMQNFDETYTLVPIYIDRNGVWKTGDNLQDARVYSNFSRLVKKQKTVTIICGKPYVAFKKGRKYSKFMPVHFALLCTHGKFGEDGALQGILSSAHIPYSSCDVKASAVTMDKVFMKDILVARRVPTVEYYAINFDDFKKNPEKVLKNVKNKVKFPLILKPANLGSSIGIKVCHEESEFFDACEFCNKFDSKILAERFVENMVELNCACVHMNGSCKVSSVQVVDKKDEIFSFENKYLCDMPKNKIKLDKKIECQVKKMTQMLYKIFGLFGVVRVDFIFDKDREKLYVNEINSIPGALAFYLFKDMSFKDLITCLIEEGRERFCREKYITAYDSEALEIYKNLKIQNKQK